MLNLVFHRMLKQWEHQIKKLRSRGHGKINLSREEVRNLGQVRQRKEPSRFRDGVCLLVNSEMEEPKTVHEQYNGEQSSQWREAME